MKMVLETIAVEGHRFSSIDEAVLRAAASDERTQNPVGCANPIAPGARAWSASPAPVESEASVPLTEGDRTCSPRFSTSCCAG
jgi:hypothetical protein